MRIVIDTNDFISALIGKKHREKLAFVLNHPDVEIFGDENLITEIRDVGYREKFRKYVDIEEVDIFIEIISQRLTFMETSSTFFDSLTPTIIICFLWLMILNLIISLRAIKGICFLSALFGEF